MFSQLPLRPLRRARLVSRFARQFGNSAHFGNSAQKVCFLAALTIGIHLSWAGHHAATAQEAPRFSISPRFFLTTISANEDEDQPLLYLYGLSGSVRLATQWDFSATVLNGEGSGGSFDSTKESKLKRFDWEALVRYRFPESSGYVVGGFRNINVTDTENRYGAFDGESKTNVYVGEIGGGFASRLSKSGRHAAFANLVLGLGSTDAKFRGADGSSSDSTGFTYLLDANVGYQYAFSSSLSVSARYRMIFVNIEVDGNANVGSVHGPEIALTYRF